MNNNPLSKYFRTPGMHITIPSNGYFNPGDIEFTINGEIPVYPMTAADEILTKNPDGLLNGYAIENIIKSCVPNIKNPKKLPAQDIDVLLLAIKHCSYGDRMEVNCKCPKCKSDNSYDFSIRHLLSDIKMLEKEYIVRVNDEIVIYLKPYDYEASTKLNLAAFEETKLFQNLMNAKITEEERIKYFNQSFEKIATLNLDLMSKCIIKIAIPDGVVDDIGMIKEFVMKTERKVIKKIQDTMSEISSLGLNKKVEIQCSNEKCGNVWKTDLIFDPSHFFG